MVRKLILAVRALRRANDPKIVLFRDRQQLFHVGRFICPRRDFGHLCERLLKTGRGHDNQHLCRPRCWIREGMDRSPGHEGECTCTGLKRSLSNLNFHLALDDIDRFFFALVYVRGWSRSSRRSRHFDEAVTAASIAPYCPVGVPVSQHRDGLPLTWSQHDQLRDTHDDPPHLGCSTLATPLSPRLHTSGGYLRSAAMVPGISHTLRRVPRLGMPLAGARSRPHLQLRERCTSGPAECTDDQPPGSRLARY